MDLFQPKSQLITLRPYQRQAVDAVYAHLRDKDDNPCVVIPTGGGKTPVIATICSDAVNLWSGRVLILAHVKELLQQASEKLTAVCPNVDVGLYSAGLNRRDTQHPVIIAGIQSVYQRAADLGHFDLLIVDEAHMIPMDGDGMYRRFLKEAKLINPALRVIGLTATPFRLSSGPICAAAPEGILNSICFDVGVRELITQGYLSPLRSKAGKYKPNLDDVRLRGGEFVADEVEAVMGADAVVFSACREIVDATTDRKSCLIFATGVKHAQHVAKTIESMAGQECGLVEGQTAALFREQILRRFKAGELKYLCNVNVLTTGFDAPNVDTVALLRPTMSPGLYYQMVGRGFRLSPGKADCLVLDFGGNVMRHGPVDQIRVADSARRSTGEAPAKECPQCNALLAAGFSICPECGYEFPPPAKSLHDGEADAAGILSGDITITEHDVLTVHYAVHEKRGAEANAPKTMRVDYRIGFYRYKSEWVCVEHDGFARQKAEIWWRKRSNCPIPMTAQEAVDLAHAGALAETMQITVREVAGEKFDRIIEHQLGPKPPVPEGYEAATDPPAPSEPEPQYTPADDDIPF